MFEDDSPADPKMLLFRHMGNPWEIPSGNPGPHVSGKKIPMSWGNPMFCCQHRWSGGFLCSLDGEWSSSPRCVGSSQMAATAAATA